MAFEYELKGAEMAGVNALLKQIFTVSSLKRPKIEAVLRNAVFSGFAKAVEGQGMVDAAMPKSCQQTWLVRSARKPRLTRSCACLAAASVRESDGI